VVVDMAIAVAAMVDVRVVTMVIVVVSADSVAQWVLDVVPVVLVVLVEIAEKVVMDSDLQIAAGREIVYIPFSTVNERNTTVGVAFMTTRRLGINNK
jgi:hypothetical protein